MSLDQAGAAEESGFGFGPTGFGPERSPARDALPRAAVPVGQPELRAPIRVLPTGVAAQIAAGETIERPASVVKELVENAIDAGASSVRIDVRGGGLGLIRVGDDGVGIRAPELWLACQRHATSKMGAGDRLDGIRSLGFRGEALPSIAAVAELSLLCSVDDRGLGWKLTLRDGRVVADEPAPRPRGTTASVRHLFQNLPARLAAAAKPPAETAHIGQVVRRLAVAAPGVRLTLVVDDRVVLQTGGSGELADVLVECYGQAVAESLLPLGLIEAVGVSVRGVVSGPELTRPGRGHLHVAVNGRGVQVRGLLQAVEAAYRPVLPRGRHPILALALATAPDRVDVNVHPAKLEVRLRDERALGAAIGEAVREALGRRPLGLGFQPVTGIEALGRDAVIAEETLPYDDDGLIITTGLPPLRLLGQLRHRLLLLEGEAGLFLVDQHRAHERILFERLAAGGAAGDGTEPVALPEPILIELSPRQAAGFGDRLDQLGALGFGCERFGGRTFLLKTAPVLPGVVGATAGEGGPFAPLAGLGRLDGVGESLLALDDDEAAGEGEAWRERLLVRLACRTAVRRGRPLDRPAMRALVLGLGETASPAVCPHGSPLLMQVAGDLLERQFGWH